VATVSNETLADATELTLISALSAFFGSDTNRIAHALKVYAITKHIAQAENFTLAETKNAVYAAILHDVGIKIGEEKNGKCTHKDQELYGPPAALEIMAKAGVDTATADRVAWIIGHHLLPQPPFPGLVHGVRNNSVGILRQDVAFYYVAGGGFRDEGAVVVEGAVDFPEEGCREGLHVAEEEEFFG
jgi:hypothetical protein